MNCIKKSVIQKYLDGEIPNDEIIRIESHLKKCKECSEKVEQQRIRNGLINDMMNNLTDKEVVRPPLSLLFNPMLQVVDSADQNDFKSGWSSRKRLLYGLCGACAVLLFLIYPLRILFDKQKKVIQIQEVIRDVDANRPLTDQETVVTVIDPDGNVSYME
jgi:hypothetical protein